MNFITLELEFLQVGMSDAEQVAGYPLSYFNSHCIYLHGVIGLIPE